MSQSLASSKAQWYPLLNLTFLKIKESTYVKLKYYMLVGEDWDLIDVSQYFLNILGDHRAGEPIWHSESQ